MPHATENPFKLSPVWYWIAIILVIVGLIYGFMVFFQNPSALNPADNGNINRATLSFLAAIAFGALAIYQSHREEYKGIVGGAGELASSYLSVPHRHGAFVEAPGQIW
jgi:peptidoglycan/LPS O-acetylase OafA/YrhL